MKNLFFVTAICIMALFFVALGSPAQVFAGDNHYQSAEADNSGHAHDKGKKDNVQKKKKKKKNSKKDKRHHGKDDDHHKDENRDDDKEDCEADDLPIVFPDFYSTDEDTPFVTGNVLINDCEEADECDDEEDEDDHDDERELLITGFTRPTNGALVDNGDSTFTYTPAPDYNGRDSFTYTVKNDDDCMNAGTVSITVNPVNDLPVAIDQYVSTDEDSAVTITLTAADIENDPLTYSVVTVPLNGTLSGIAPDLTYTPNLNYNGPDSFTFIANDGQGDSQVATVSVTVFPVNDVPEADAGVAQNVFVRDVVILDGTSSSDIDGDSLTYNWSLISKPVNSIAVLDDPTLPTPSFTADEPGTFQFDLLVNDGSIDSAADSVVINAELRPALVPDATGLSQFEAETLIQNTYLQVGTVAPAHSDTVPQGNIICQEPVAGTVVLERDSVNLVVSYHKPITTVAAIPAEIINGQSALITWSVTNAESVTIDNGIGEVPVDGSMEVAPFETTTYTLYAVGVTGTDTSAITVTVLEPPFAMLTGDRNAVAPGGSATLSWLVTGSDSAYLEPDMGVVPLNGKTVVVPVETTTYTLTANGANGTATSHFTIEVVDRPTAQLITSDSRIYADEIITLSWNTTNADTCTIEPSIGPVDCNSSIQTSPAETTVYKLIVTGPTGVTTAEQKVEVIYPLVGSRSDWKYNNNGIDLGTAWRELSFNDDSWYSGNGVLGYGEGGLSTWVSYGPDPDNKPITTYFRKTFQVNDPSAIKSLKVGLRKDDGAAVYLNGVEIIRANIPDVNVSYNSRANWSSDDGDRYYETIVDASALVAGLNIIAVEVHQGSADSSDMQFDFYLTGLTEPMPLVPSGSVWRYLDNGSDQGTAWTAPDFDHSGWSTGQAQFGFGEHDQATTVSYGPDRRNKYITTYFRKKITISDLSMYKSYLMDIIHDAGAVVYLNGHKIWRGNMPAGDIGYKTLSSGEGSNYVFHAVLPPDYFVEGENTLAVELHHNNPTWGDVSFDLQLEGSTEPMPVVPLSSVWRYLDNGSDQGTAWRMPGFDDSAWKAGRAQLGYGESDQATTVSYGPDRRNKYITTYFRKKITIDSPSLYESFTMGLIRDAGAVVYLNGREVERGNMPEGDIGYMTLPLSEGNNQIFYSTLHPDYFIEGVNTLAVELHHNNPTWGDISFALELDGKLKDMRPVKISTGSSVILEGEATDLSWDSIDAVSVSIDQGIGAVPISGTMLVSPSQTTTYTITATLADGSTVSATTTIVVAQPMTLRIQAPVDGSTTHSPSTTVSGTVDGSVAAVMVNNILATLSNGIFSADVPLVAGDNPLTVVVVDQADNTISSAVSIRYEDITPPEITIISPVDGDTTTASRITVSGSIDDPEATVMINDIPATVSGNTFVAENVPLRLSGLNTLHVVATDPYDNSSTASVTLNCAAQPLVRFRTGNQIIRDGQSTVLSWETFYADNVTIDNGLGAVSLSGSYEVSPSATTTYTLTASGSTGTTTSKVTVTVTGPPPTASFDQQLIKISQGGTATLSWTSTNSQYAHIDNGVGSVLTNGTLDVTPEATTSYTLTVTGPSGSASTKVLVKVLGNPAPQPEGSFGEQYFDLVPEDAVVASYDVKRFSVIIGEIKDLASQPIAGVRVSILGHPEYGTTETGADGKFALPVEGGYSLTVKFEREDLINAQRKVSVLWNDVTIIEPFQMLNVDPVETNFIFDGNPATVETHTSSLVIDEFGNRSTTMVFTGDNQAWLVDEDGNDIQPLNTITTRATEFETEESMPAKLPPTTAYTYCAEMEIVGAQRVRFDKPVITWVDNFIGFEVGSIVPSGYYNRDIGAWVPSPNGIVVQLLDTDNDGVVDALDSDGDSLPDDMNNDGSYNDEVRGLNDPQRFIPGESFWRVELTHFSPNDFNWNLNDDEDPPKPEEPTVENDEEEDDPEICPIEIASYVDQKNRYFHEDIPLVGTGMTLHYTNNSYDAGKKYAIRVPVNTNFKSTNRPYKILITLWVAGRIYQEEVPVYGNSVVTFAWDGKDWRDDLVSGRVWANIIYEYFYDADYLQPCSGEGYAFGTYCTSYTTGRRFARPTKRKQYTFVKSINTPQRGTLANGWTLSDHHYLSTQGSNVLFKGDGSSASNTLSLIDTTVGQGQAGYNGDGIDALSAMLYEPYGVFIDAAGNTYIADTKNHRIRKVDTNGIITTIAGTGVAGFSGDGGPATQAQLNRPYAVFVDELGIIYIVDRFNQRVRKIDRNGIISTVAGNGTAGFSGDGGPAVEAQLDGPFSIAKDRYGSLYITDKYNHRIRRVDPGGIISTVAGTGIAGYSGDGGPAVDARLDTPRGAVVDAQGNIYIADSDNHRVRKVDTNGIITTIAGTGTRGYSGDGGPAVDAEIALPRALAVDSVGNIYIADHLNHAIRKVDSSGIINTVAGNGSRGFGGDGGPAVKGSIYYPRGITIGPNDKLYIADMYNHRIRKVSELPSQFTDLLASRDYIFTEGGTGYIMSGSGHHKATIDLNNQTVLKRFGYDSRGRLITVTDRFGNQTTIDRDAGGTPLSITSPDGQTTFLTIDSGNNLTEVILPDGSSYSFQYTGGGLMTVETEPNGNRFVHTFDEAGKLDTVLDEEGGEWTLSDSMLADGTVVAEILTGEGNITTYEDKHHAGGLFESIVTRPDGSIGSVTVSADGLTTTAIQPCGMTTETISGIDPQYKTAFTRQRIVTTPAGLVKQTFRDKIYQDTDFDGSPDLFTKTTTINGRTTIFTDNILTGTRTVTSPEGRQRLNYYDTATLLSTSTSTPGLFDTNFAYDTRGRLISTTTGTRMTSMGYNADGFLDYVTDPEGFTTSYTYDPMGRVTSVLRPDNTTLSYVYDANGNMTILSNPALIDHGFDHNAVNKRTSYQTPLSGSYQYIYDKDRRLIRKIFPSGAAITNVYDTINLSQVQTPEGTIDYTYFCSGKVDTITFNGQAISYEYDGSIKTAEHLTGTLNQTLSYTHNNDFAVESFTYAGGTQFYTYDNDGLLTGAGDFTISRNIDNGLAESVFDNGVTINRTYNGYGEVDGEVTAVAGTALAARSISRDNAGRIITKTETVDGVTSTYDYTYDSMGRLLTVTKDGILVEEYQYDITGTRIYEMNTRRGIAGRSMIYSDEDHLLTAGDVQYQYDLDGFLTSRTDGAETTGYEYSSRGELLSVTLPDGRLIKYIHDPLGRRIAKKIDGIIVEKYLWQGLTKLLAVYDGNDNLVMRFEYADNRMPVAMTMGGARYYLAYDQVGTLKLVVDAAGNVVKKIDHDSFGNIINDSNPAFTVPFGFAGGLYDRDTGLVRFGYRDYDPDTGRWTAKDPILFAGGDTDLYGYVQNDPVNWVDSYGLCPQKENDDEMDEIDEEFDDILDENDAFDKTKDIIEKIRKDPEDRKKIDPTQPGGGLLGSTTSDSAAG